MSDSRRFTLKMEHLVVLVAAVVGLVDGTSRLSDNSMLVHLTTGIHIYTTHRVPHLDPYSFTARGDSWVVQSWFPELIYGALYKWGGGHLFIAFNMAFYAVLGGVLASMCRTGNWLRTVGVGVVVIGFGLAQWTSRPTGFALLYMALTVLIVSRKKSFWWLAPVGLLWVNSHGSWPLGFVWIALLGFGYLVDRKPWKLYFRYILALAAGVLVGGLASPAGWRVLTFPLVPLGARHGAFSDIVEWQSPNFRSLDLGSGVLILGLLLIVVVIFSRVRPGWSGILPAVAFMALSLTGSRNLPFLGIILAPTLAYALKNHVPDTPPIDKKFYISNSAGAVGWGVVGVLLLVVASQVFTFLARPAFNYSTYPTKATTWMQNNGLSPATHRVYAADWVGCYMIFRYQNQANVFIDDRYDMYPISVTKDSLDIGHLAGSPDAVINKYKLDALLIAKDTQTARLLEVDPHVLMVHEDKKWEVFTPAAQQ